MRKLLIVLFLRKRFTFGDCLFLVFAGMVGGWPGAVILVLGILLGDFIGRAARWWGR